MLQKIYIRNYAIIDELTIAFDKHLTVITGETGAGKSIILGALSLILGERADTSVLINQNEKCIVEAVFDMENNNAFNKRMCDADLDVEPLCIIRREINTSGKSRAFINDTPVTLPVLHSLTSLLVDLHRQFDTRALLETDFYYDVVDAMAGTSKQVADYRISFNEYKELQAEYDKLKQQQEQWNKESDYKQFLYDELIEANFVEKEIEDNEIALKQLSHHDVIKTTLQHAGYILDVGDENINIELKKVLQQLQSIHQVLPDIEIVSKRLESTWIELKDIAEELSNMQDKIDIDPEKLQQIQDRQDIAYRLLKKHNVTTTEEIISIKQQLEDELKAKNSVEETLQSLQNKLENIVDDLNNKALVISEKRVQIASQFSGKINNLLALVGMPNASIKIEIDQDEKLTVHGKDKILFMLDANNTGKYVALQKTASGGEMSRIMLSIKALTAKALNLPTLIFDEVDSGISGEAARQVGILLRSLSEYHQVICITHQPQVAAKGHQHFFVYKSGDDSGIKTRIKQLNTDEHIDAIARMIGGDSPSDAAMKNAKELATN